MKQVSRHNLKIVLLIFLILIISIAAVLLVMTFAGKVNTLAYAITASVTVEGDSQTLRCWPNEGTGDYYIFLPAGAEKLQLLTRDTQQLVIDDLQAEFSVSDLTMSAPYACRVLENGRCIAEGNLVFMQSAEIPSLFITTPSGSLEYIHANKNNTETGELNIWGTNPMSADIAEFGGRGNTSWDCDKKGYKLVFDDAVSLLGLEEAQKYVLIANARCNYLSNNIAFWLEEEIGILYANQSAFVDLYVNGEYLGNYVLCEPIYAGENGIPISDLEKQNFLANPGINTKDLETYQSKDGQSKGVLWKNEPAELSGGYLLERDVAEYYAEEDSGFVLSSGDHFVIKSPKHASQNQVEYIRAYMQEVYDAVSASDGFNPATGKCYSEYIDLESFALKYLLEEFLNFNDAGRSSAYYYKDADGLLCAGPGWDFEGAFLKSAEQLTYLNNTPYSTDFYEKLMQHEDFRKAVISAYNERLLPAVTELLNAWMPSTMQLISASASMDAVRWGREDFAADCAEIASWVRTRSDFLDTMWNGNERFVTVTIQDDWANKEYIYLSPGETLTKEMLSQFYAVDALPSYWTTENGERLIEDSEVILEDLTVRPVYVVSTRSTADVLLGYAGQLLPEIIFGAAFFVVAVCYLCKLKQRRKKS